MKIIAHTLIKNEESFIWFAVNSIINHVDEIFIWDNGSSDSTVRIIESIRNPKIKFKKITGVRPEIARQKMLEASRSFDWIFILDGDEIWSETAITSCKLKIANSGCDVVVVPNYMLIGDIFHYQESQAGKYNVAGKMGHYNIRAIRNLPGLHIEGIYPDEAFVTEERIKVQDLPKDRVLFLNTSYLHASFLKKKKYEIGEEFPKDFYYPEVFFRDRPKFIPSPWKIIDLKYKLNAFWQTPVKKVKRKIFE